MNGDNFPNKDASGNTIKTHSDRFEVLKWDWVQEKPSLREDQEIEELRERVNSLKEALKTLKIELNILYAHKIHNATNQYAILKIIDSALEDEK